MTLQPAQQLYLFLGFFAAFAVKVPIFPFHTWLPAYLYGGACSGYFPARRRHVEDGHIRPAALRIALFPGGAHRCASWIVVLAIIGIIYGALLALDSAEHQAPDRVFFDQPSGLHRARHLHLQSAGRGWRGVSDDCAWPLDRRAIPAGWLSGAAARLHGDRGLRRHRHSCAGARRSRS